MTLYVQTALRKKEFETMEEGLLFVLPLLESKKDFRLMEYAWTSKYVDVEIMSMSNGVVQMMDYLNDSPTLVEVDREEAIRRLSVLREAS